MKTRLLKSVLFPIVFAFANFLLITVANGQAVGDYRSVATGNWSTLATWERLNVLPSTWATPTAGQGWPGQLAVPGNVLLQNTFTVSIIVSVPNPIGSLNVGLSGAGSASLTFNNNSDLILTVTGTVNIDDGSITAPNVAGNRTHTFSIGGNLIVNTGSSFNMVSGDATDFANVTFNGTANQTVSGAGTPVNFNLINVNNTGAANNNIVDINTSVFTVPANFATLTAGILKMSGSYTLSNTFFTPVGYTIPVGTGIWLNNTNVTVTAQAGEATLNGLLRITAGTYNVGTTTHSMTWGNNSVFTMEGGAFNVAARLAPASAVSTNSIAFTMSGGTLTTSMGSSTPANTVATQASFDIPATGTASSFIMSGGTIVMRKLASGVDYRMSAAGTVTITGGTVQFGDASTAGSPAFKVGAAAGATNVFPSLSINATGTPTVTLNTPVIVRGNVSIATGTSLIANGQDITVSGNTLPGTATGSWTNNGLFTAGAGTVTFNSTQIGSTISVNLTGTSKFNNIVFNGSGTWSFLNSADAANFTITTGTVTAPTGTLSITGNFSNSGTFISSTGTVSFTGTLLQTITGSTNTPFFNLFFYNTLPGTVISILVSTGALISGQATFTDGIVSTVGLVTLAFNNDATVTGASDISFVSGSVIKIGDDAFTFPVGQLGAGYHPIGMSAPSTIFDAFGAQYVRSSGTLLGGVNPPLTQVSNCEFWVLDRGLGASNVSVTLYWTASSGCGGLAYITDLPTLVVARRNGTPPSNWSSEGAILGGGSTTIAGNITTAVPVTNWAANALFTLGSTSILTNPLPVKFGAIKGYAKNNGIQVDWTTYTESNLDHYEVERSADGTHFSTIGQAPARNSLNRSDYGWFDPAPLSNTNFYRIRSIDLDGKVNYSIIIRVDLHKTGGDITIYPNPVQGGVVVFQTGGLAKGIYTLRVLNSAGQQVASQKLNHNGGTLSQSVPLPASIKAGVYYLQLENGEENLRQKFIVQ